MNQPNWQLIIIPLRDSYRSIQWTFSLKSAHYLSLVSLHRRLHDQSYLSYESDQIVLFFSNNLMSFSNISLIGMFRIYVYRLVIIVLWSYQNFLVIAYAHGPHYKHHTIITMNKFHFNKHKQDTWKYDWLIAHIVSIILEWHRATYISLSSCLIFIMKSMSK